MTMEHSEEVLQSPASQRLREFLRARQQAWQQGVPEFEQFERGLHEGSMNLERECIAQELARYDGAAERIEVAGVSYQPVLQAAETYLSTAGPVRVERHLYRPAGRNAKSLCPLELRAGIINSAACTAGGICSHNSGGKGGVRCILAVLLSQRGSVRKFGV